MPKEEGAQIVGVDRSLATRLMTRARQVMARAPGGHFMLGQARAVEDVLVQHLKVRLDDMGGHYYLPAPSQRLEGAVSGAPVVALSARFAALSEQSLNQTPDSANQALFSRIVNQLVPDEARILTAISDGSGIAVSHLLAISRFKGKSHRMMEFLSRIGNESGVMLADMVPCYLRHLYSLGLLDSGPEDSRQTAKYEAIENGSDVRKACEQIRRDSKLNPVFIRETVQLSEFGKAFWSACCG
ncbi:MAG: Abi-alpha family protein [Alcanivorax sp.]|nr:Abi-alpha family protein [Alcanivorax sp.]